ncbi:MAG: Holliday junction resolvase RuvX [Planctomycetes bacterium]|nr:Holliday junction resolvase RuvX [Planctomycetota bacterium]
MTRWLGIDHGSRRIGVAVSDAGGSIASPLEGVPAEPASRAFERIAALAAEYGAAGAVVGWPLNTDDTEGPQGALARRFAIDLAEATGLDVRLWDERFTSAAADAKLAGLYTRRQKKARQDAVAAAMILGDFLAVGGPDAAPTAAEAVPPRKSGR